MVDRHPLEPLPEVPLHGVRHAARVVDQVEGLVPLVVPLTLIGHQVRWHDIDYPKGQVILQSHPKELMLRSHV